MHNLTRTLLATLLVFPIVTSAEPALSFGVVPQQAASKLARAWGPLLEEVSARAGVHLEFATATNIPTFESRVRDGDYDFAYMNPYHYTVFSQRPGYRVVAKEKGILLFGLLVVRRDSPLATLSELDGLRIAFPAPAAFAATLLPRAELDRRGIAYDPKFVSSHDSVYLGVTRGLYPAGTGVVRTLETLEPSLRAQLRVLWRTPGYPPHAIAVHPRVPAEQVKRVTAALRSLESDPEGRRLLAVLQFNGIEAAEDAEWDPVRAAGIRSLLQSD